MTCPNVAPVAYLDENTAELIDAIDELLVSWMTRAGARPLLLPPLLAAADLDWIGYFQQFAHQANVVTTLNVDDNSELISPALRHHQLNPAVSRAYQAEWLKTPEEVSDIASQILDPPTHGATGQTFTFNLI
jgi:hypothetical protein